MLIHPYSWSVLPCLAVECFLLWNEQLIQCHLCLLCNGRHSWHTLLVRPCTTLVPLAGTIWSDHTHTHPCMHTLKEHTNQCIQCCFIFKTTLFFGSLLVYCLNNIILLVTLSHLSVARTSSSFKHLDMCTRPTYTTATFMNEVLCLVYVQLLLK